MTKRGLLAAACMIAAASFVTSGAKAQDKPVFGLVMSFSGWFQPIDADTIAGAKLAVDDINAAGGVLGQPIEIVEFDNKSEPPLGADGAIDVIDKGAKAILFPSDFDFGAPGAFVAQQKNVIAFSAASDPKFGVKGVGPLAYSVSNAGQAQGALMAEWAYNKKGWKKAYVLLDNTISYTKSLCGSFAERWKEVAGAEGLLGEDTFLNGDASIAAQVTRITSLAEKPDLVFLCSYAPGGPSAIRQIARCRHRGGGPHRRIDGRRLLDRQRAGPQQFLRRQLRLQIWRRPRRRSERLLRALREEIRQEGRRLLRAARLFRRPGLGEGGQQGRLARRRQGSGGARTPSTRNRWLIGPTTWTADLHIETTRPMSIIGVQDGKFAAEGRFSVEKFPAVLTASDAKNLGDGALELAAERVSVRFGGLVANDDVSLAIASGEVLGLIGPNGAGKTTLVNILSGFQRPHAGAIRLAGSDMTGRQPGAFARAGIVRSFQAVRLFRGLTVAENVEVGLVGRGLGRAEARRRCARPARRFRSCFIAPRSRPARSAMARSAARAWRARWRSSRASCCSTSRRPGWRRRRRRS